MLVNETAEKIVAVGIDDGKVSEPPAGLSWMRFISGESGKKNADAPPGEYLGPLTRSPTTHAPAGGRGHRRVGRAGVGWLQLGGHEDLHERRRQAAGDPGRLGATLGSAAQSRRNVPDAAEPLAGCSATLANARLDLGDQAQNVPALPCGSQRPHHLPLQTVDAGQDVVDGVSSGGSQVDQQLAPVGGVGPPLHQPSPLQRVEHRGGAGGGDDRPLGDHPRRDRFAGPVDDCKDRWPQIPRGRSRLSAGG